MEWYRVIKTIKGHQYAYEQRTWREGGRVRTENRYLGPVGDGGSGQDQPPAPLSPAPGKPEPRSRPQISIDPELATKLLDQLTKRENAKALWKHGWVGRSLKHSLVEPHQDIEDLISYHQFSITFTGKGASYNPRTHRLTVPPTNRFRHSDNATATQEYYGTFFHEMVHWTSHKEQCRRNVVPAMGDTTTYAREELVAELGSVMLLTYYNMAPSDISNHATYFRGWLNRIPVLERKEAVSYAKHHALQAVRYLVERSE